MSLLLASRRLRATAASLLLSAATSTFALDTATIVSSALSPDCLEYRVVGICYWLYCTPFGCRSEEHTSELQSLMRISYAVFCLKKNNNLRPHDNILCTLTM